MSLREYKCFPRRKLPASNYLVSENKYVILTDRYRADGSAGHIGCDSSKRIMICLQMGSRILYARAYKVVLTVSSNSITCCESAIIFPKRRVS